MVYSKEIVREWLDEVAERAKEHPEWVDVFERCYTDTLDNTVEILEDGSTFVLTGDIPAMWLRDSTAQLRPYLHVAKRDPRLRQTIAGLVKRQMTLILRIPMPTLSILRRTGRVITRQTIQTSMAGFGNVSMKWIRFAIPCNWLIFFGRKLVRLASLMKLLLRRLRRFSISGRWNKITRTHLTVLFVIPIVRKTLWLMMVLVLTLP